MRPFTILRTHYANVTATLALAIALGGTAYAVVQLPANSVGSREIRNGSVRQQDLASGAKPLSRADLRDAVVEVVTDPDTPNIKISVVGEKGEPGAAGAAGPAGSAGAAGSTGPAGSTGSAGTPGANGSGKAYGLLQIDAGQPYVINEHELVAIKANDGSGMTWCAWSPQSTENIQLSSGMAGMAAVGEKITSSSNRSLWCPLDDSHPWQWAIKATNADGSPWTAPVAYAWVVLN